jgi:hypothetical protein
MCLHQARRLGFCQQAPPRAEAILGTGDPAQISSTGCATTRNPEMHRLAHVSSHVFDAAEERGYGIQSHAGTLAAFNSAINLGCVYPGNHACETCSSGSGLVLGVFTGSEWNVAILVCRCCSVRESTRQRNDGQRDTKKGTKTCPFGSSMVSSKSVQIFWKEMAGTTRLELATSAVTESLADVTYWNLTVLTARS